MKRIEVNSEKLDQIINIYIKEIDCKDCIVKCCGDFISEAVCKVKIKSNMVVDQT